MKDYNEGKANRTDETIMKLTEELQQLRMEFNALKQQVDRQTTIQQPQQPTTQQNGVSPIRGEDITEEQEELAYQFGVRLMQRVYGQDSKKRKGVTTVHG